jgi:hypothetical protein
MAQVVVVAEQVWASLAGRQHALLSAVFLGRSVVDLTLHLYSARQKITLVSIMRVTLENDAARALWYYAHSVSLAAGRPIKYEVPMAVLG